MGSNHSHQAAEVWVGKPTNRRARTETGTTMAATMASTSEQEEYYHQQVVLKSGPRKPKLEQITLANLSVANLAILYKLVGESRLHACLFVLRFYGPVNPMGSCRAWSVYLTTHLLGRLSPLSSSPVLCTFFRQKLTTALLESAEGRE